ncbi:MAG: hypothetical protein KAI66_16170 [Lentisphaeria bacterium]|nr:hypothetical protein [Lentisphaeria bacterium]
MKCSRLFPRGWNLLPTTVLVFALTACTSYTSDPPCNPACNASLCMVCDNGTCLSSCTNDQVCNNGTCVTEQACDPACDASLCMVCDNGTCISSCTNDQVCNNGTCVTEQACDPACDASQCMVCDNGTCLSSCTNDQVCNNGTCVTDPVCNPPCDASLCMVCDNGTCISSCTNGLVCRDGTCVTDMEGELGETCVSDADCLAGRCLKYTGDTEGYCTTTDCLADDDCINYAVGENREMCCVEVASEYFICLKIAEGYSCGTTTGTCGATCTGTGDSACEVGFPCLRSSDTDPQAICSQMCITDADCAACEWSEGPSAEISCVTISGGDKYCLITEVNECFTSLDCPEGDTCVIGVSADYTDLFGECMNFGGLPPGSECNDEDDPNELPYEDRCSAIYCFGDMCTEVCQVDTDCPEGMLCEVLQFSDVDDTIKVCMGDASCGSPADCPEGEVCWPTLSGDALTGWCRANEGTDPVGTECTDADDTCEAFCMEPLCSEWCTLDTDCPNTMICETINFCLEYDTSGNCIEVIPGTICLQDNS